MTHTLVSRPGPDLQAWHTLSRTGSARRSDQYPVFDAAEVRNVVADLLFAASEPVTAETIALALLTHFNLDHADPLQVRIMTKRVGVCLIAESQSGRVRTVGGGWVLAQ